MSLARGQGTLVTFSGCDGSGKSTQLALLEERLRREGFPVARVWNRVGYTRWFQELKGLIRRVRPGAIPKQGTSYGRHKELGKPRTRAAWFLFASTDLLRLYNVTIRRLMAQGTIVLCDRYLPDSQVDLMLHFPETDLADTQLWRLVRRLSPKPDVGLFFDVPLDVALARADVKQEIYRQPDNMVSKRLAAYAEIRDSFGLTIVDGDRPADVIHEETYERLMAALGDAPSLASAPSPTERIW